MNVAMKLLHGLGVLREGEPDAAGTGGGLNTPDFTPGNLHQQQGEGIFEAQREALKAQQAEDEADDTDDLTPAQKDEVAQQEQAPTGEENSSENDAQEPSANAFTYQGVAVEVENNPEMVTAFKEKGLDIDKVNTELFSEAGLTAETKQSLYDAFGKLSVDMYLDGWKNQHDALVLTHKTEGDAWVNARNSLADKESGGNWDGVLEWATKSLTEAEYSQYQQIINGDNDLACAMAIRELTAKSGLGGGNPLVPSKSTVRQLAITPANNAAPEQSNAISAAEYQKAFTDKLYWKDPAGWDAKRRAGQAAGI